MRKFTVSALLNAYREQPKGVLENTRLSFRNIENEDVYNPAYPIMLDGKLILPARVERRDSEDSRIVMFEQDSECDAWKPILEFFSPKLQDPFWIQLDTMLLLGGVHVNFSPTGIIKNWETVFLSCKDIKNFRPFFTGPKGMKDLRICSLQEGKIAIFTRPQGNKKGGRGQIGFSILDSLRDLTIQAVENATLLDLFVEEEWGGVNHAQLLCDGTLGVLGHIACFSSDMHKHYYPISFTIDPMTGILVNEPSIILERRDLLPGPSKRPDLQDIIFPGGCVQSNSTSTLYLGVGDAEVQKVVLNNLFFEF